MPTLVDLTHDAKQVPAVHGGHQDLDSLYTFNRETGAPIFPIEEKPVPQDAVPGETPSPTQPFPSAPPALVRQAPLTPDDAWGVAWFDTRACRKRIAADRSEGIFQPPTTKESIMLPGNAGGSNWGGIAFDPEHQHVVANTVDLPFLVALVPRDQLEAELRVPQYDPYEFGPCVARPAPCAAARSCPPPPRHPLREAALGQAHGGGHGARYHQVADPPG